MPDEFFKEGKIIGCDPGIIDAFTAKLGVKPQLVDMAGNGIIPALCANKFDVIVPAVLVTKQRAEKVSCMLYADASNGILLRANEDKINTADDLSGKIAGVQIGRAAAASFRSCSTNTSTRSSMLVVMKDAPGNFKMISGVTDITAYFPMAFGKEDTAFQSFVNEQLAEMKQDGTLARLQKKWFGSTMETPDTVPEVLP